MSLFLQSPDAGKLELGFPVTRLPIHMVSWPHAPARHVPPSAASDDASSSRRVELIVSDSEHTPAHFPHIIYNKYISLRLYYLVQHDCDEKKTLSQRHEIIAARRSDFERVGVQAHVANDAWAVLATSQSGVAFDASPCLRSVTADNCRTRF